MVNFYIDLKVVDPYIKFLYGYQQNIVKFVKDYEKKFDDAKQIFNDANVVKFVKSIETINENLSKLSLTIHDCADVMKKIAIAYQKYLGR